VTQYHIAQVNIARAKAEMDDEVMSEFVSRLDEINALADNSPGFIWRLKDDEGNFTSIRVFDDALLLVNMSVWQDIESLRNFVYKSSHVELIGNREAWFNKLDSAHQALWWIPQGTVPSVEDAKERLDHIRQHGSTETAFTFGRPFDPPK